MRGVSNHGGMSGRTILRDAPSALLRIRRIETYSAAWDERAGRLLAQ
jgi:hypothetical protein